ncbi:MAG: hypothetical protein BGO60_12235 [Thiobacillus sp. 65-1059]|nr:MAG: hypothetical protein BGO60_12235 [Thiobacillus sp. 65-1059]
MHTKMIFPLLLGALVLDAWATPVPAPDEDKPIAGSKEAFIRSDPGIVCTGPGMMGGGWGMGAGMMGGRWGMSPWSRSDLSADQRTKINTIRDETRRKNWELMGRLMDEQARLRDLYDAPTRDAGALDNGYKKVNELQRQIYDSSEDAYKRMEAILTKEQREKPSWRFWRHW